VFAERLSQQPEVVKPRYGAACFADLPQTLFHLLTGQGAPALAPEILNGLAPTYDKVILILVDAFGWRFFERYQEDHPFLTEIAKEGVVARLTSQFPSTTAAHVTCIHTGLTPGQSGVYEWQYYEPQLDLMITPLLFSFAGELTRETLQTTGVEPGQLYPATTIYPTLQQYGVASHVFQPVGFAYSTYSQQMTAGAKMVPYRTLPEALVNLEYLLAQQLSKAYFNLYLGDIDSICHRYGPVSRQIEAEIDILLTTMDRWLLRQLKGKAKQTLLMVVADHGQIEVDPKTTLYLNLDPRFEGVQRYLKTNRAGQLLVPAGSPRDMFLYVKDELLDEAQAFLAGRLAGQAEVEQTQRLIDEGYFGPPPVSAAFLARVGNLIILPYPHETIWWYEKDRFEQKFYGHHGGLTRQEMEIPLLLYSF